MWYTSDGDRVMRGAEWRLFQLALSSLWDEVEESFDDPSLCETGVRTFDDLQPNQKLAMLALVGQAMHDATLPSPDLTAHTEGTAAAIFDHILHSIEMEMDFQDEPDNQFATYWRDLVLDAARETEVDCEGDPFPEPRCTDLGEWDCLIEGLSSRIFWDADYDMGREFLDADPEECRAKLIAMNIDPEYFTAVAPDPPDEQLDQIREQLRQLTWRPERKEDKSYPGFEDSYNGLLVGPCDEAMLAAEIDCPWIGEIEMCGGGDGFHCTYEQWVKLFREEARQAATSAVEPVVLTAEHQGQAEVAEETGEPINLPGGQGRRRQQL
ncbi:MAG: hypothetical protein K2R98_28980 [Gemmataceae bacterium]|nr:hypothetical protein [Gemmataceae bacterium]